MKILFFTDSLGSGGAQRQLVELAKVFSDMGHECEFLIYHPLLFFEEELINNNIPIHIIREENYLKRFIKCRKFIRTGNFDAVVSFLFSPNIINELSGLFYKSWKVVTGERSANKNNIQGLKGKLTRFLHFFADSVISNSEYNKFLISEILPNLSNQNVIYNIVDLEKWKPDFETDFDNKLSIFVTASHRYLKNAKVLLEALSLLDKENLSRISVSWYGVDSKDGSYQNSQELINKYNLHHIVTFYTPSNDVHKIIHKHNVVGLFSTLEGLPNAVCEGMAAGKVILASNVSDVPILLEHQKELIFSPYNPKELAEKLELLLNSYDNVKMREVGLLNRDFAEKNFDRKVIYNEYLKHLV